MDSYKKYCTCTPCILSTVLVLPLGFPIFQIYNRKKFAEPEKVKQSAKLKTGRSIVFAVIHLCSPTKENMTRTTREIVKSLGGYQVRK